MTKKEKIPLTRSEALQEIDSELEEAMLRLDDTNERIDDMLLTMDEDEETSETAMDDTSTDAPATDEPEQDREEAQTSD